MTEPLVTIVVPACRRTEYIAEALRSALAQTWQNFEIIVSDDGPTKDIAGIVSSFSDPRLRYRDNGRNVGIALNHYRAFREARGEYIANLDDDDVWEPDFLSELVPRMEEDAAISVAFCDHQIIDQKGRILRRVTNRNSRRYRRNTLSAGRHQPFLELAVVHQTIPMAMGAVFRRSVLDEAEYPPQIGGCYDHWLAYLAARRGQAMFYHPKRLTRYRVHPGSGSSTRGIQNLRNATYVRTRFVNDPQLAVYRKNLQNALGVCYGKMALLLLRQKKYRQALIVERHAFALMNRPKTMLGLLKNTALGFLPRRNFGQASFS